jgi:hypothetical protein
MGGLSGAPRALVSALLLSLLLAGCATPPQVLDLRRSAADLPPQAEVAQVPFFPQEDYYCGPASLAMVLAWTGLDVTQDQIAPEVYTPGRVRHVAAGHLDRCAPPRPPCGPGQYSS